jgi:hypothetical protein
MTALAPASKCLLITVKDEKSTGQNQLNYFLKITIFDKETFLKRQEALSVPRNTWRQKNQGKNEQVFLGNVF